MAPSTSKLERHAWQLAMLGALACVFAYLLQRNLGLHPAVFADEWYYSKMARLMPLDEAIIPSYLYLWLFRGSNACGANFFDCVRVANALFFVGAAPFLYLTARAFTGKGIAFTLTLLALLAPANMYTAFFMPESAYWFGFCVLSWLALTRAGASLPRLALACGAVLGLMSLVKVHALFLLPALCLFLLYASWLSGGAWLGTGLLAMGLAACALFAVKFGLGYALAGKAALSLFGPFYASAANSAGGRSLLDLLPALLINGRGHLMALAVLLALPLAMLAHAVLARPARTGAGTPGLLQVYAVLMLGATASVTVLYTASLAHPGIDKEGLRLHLRYYSFVFPLLWLVAAAAIGDARTQPRPLLRWAIALGMAALLAIALVELPTYAHNVVDAPEVFSLQLTGPGGQVVVGLHLLILLLWACGSRAAPLLFLLVAVPATIVGGGAGTSTFLQQQRPLLAVDRAANYVRRVVPPAERGLITVAGHDPQHLMRAQFHIDHKDTVLLLLTGDAPIERYQLPVRNKWLLVLGQRKLPQGVKPLVTNADFTLVDVNAGNRPIGRAALSAPFGSGLIARAEGLSYAEQWGRWSNAKLVVLHFNAPLPKHLNVILTAQAYDVNATLPFTMRVGKASSTFRVAAASQELGLRFETDGNQRSLTIEVPQPVSPAERGNPHDPRTLGIGIADIEIGVAEQATASIK
jgi:hypothetical protein